MEKCMRIVCVNDTAILILVYMFLELQSLTNLIINLTSGIECYLSLKSQPNAFLNIKFASLYQCLDVDTK